MYKILAEPGGPGFKSSEGTIYLNKINVTFELLAIVTMIYGGYIDGSRAVVI